MISARVYPTTGWGAEMARRVDAHVREDVRIASKHGAEVARRMAQQRSRTGRMAEIEVLDVERTATGWSGGFRSPAWYARFQSGGTSRGVRPLRFLETGAEAMQDEARARINRIG